MPTVLLVEDEPNQRLLYRMELEDEGYCVLEASDGREALEQLEAGSPDLVVLDLRMPRMDGIKTLERMMALNARPPVVVHSAYDSLRDNPVARTADAYVVKRSDLSTLKREIERVLHLQTCG